MERVKKAIKARVTSGCSIAAQSLEKEQLPKTMTLYVVSGSAPQNNGRAKII